MESEDDGTEKAIIEWMHTFELSNGPGGGCASLVELCDGCIIAAVLAAIAPAHFDASCMTAGVMGNWAIGTSNLKMILRALEAFYHDALGKVVVDMNTVDCKAIARNNDTDELLNLLELVVGVAVLCENKNVFIQNIFSLGSDTQYVLKDLIERVMARLADVGSAEAAAATATATATATAAGGTASGADEDESFSAAGSTSAAAEVLHLKEERQRLLLSMQALQDSNGALEANVDSLREELQAARAAAEVAAEHQQRAGASTDATTTGTGAGAGAGADGGGGPTVSELQSQLFSVRRELDNKVLECESLQAEADQLRSQLTVARELQAKAAMEAQMMLDEVEIGRETAAKLQRAEATIEKFSRRLEDLPALKSENAELLRKMDDYLETVHSLETSNAKLTKMLDVASGRSVEMEGAKIEAEGAYQLQKVESERLTALLATEETLRQRAEEECTAAKNELRQLQLSAQIASEEADVASSCSSSTGDESGDPLAGTAGAAGSGGGGGGNLVQLRERVKLQELEIRTLKAAAAAGGGAPSEGTGPGSRASHDGDAATHIALQAELEAVRKAKSERDEAVLVAKRQLVDVQHELQNTLKQHRQLTEEFNAYKLKFGAENATNERDGGGASAQAKERELTVQRLTAQLKEAEQQIALKTRTAQVLEARMKEKEQNISTLEQDKAKLKTFTERTLSHFKEKFMQSLETVREEKQQLEGQLQEVISRYQRNRETSAREERLVMSAMYEVGLRTIDANISAQLGRLTTAPTTLLDAQRAEAERKTHGHQQ